MLTLKSCQIISDVNKNGCPPEAHMTPDSTVTIDFNVVQEQHMFYKRDTEKFTEKQTRLEPTPICTPRPDAVLAVNVHKI